MEMNIKVLKTKDNKIDVRDSAGIRLMLLAKRKDKGLYDYFEIRMAQADDARTRAEQAFHKHDVNISFCECEEPKFTQYIDFCLNCGLPPKED
ncbi:hypothetical protein [uncultured Draconibacterium sp.]|uniref:hypothetical protein n=1 Tax=uncultured Draconibacterium sp. TaxID=1573823 RepID=UPI0032176D73